MRKLYRHLLKLINEGQVLGFPIFPIKSTRLGKQQADDLKKKSKDTGKQFAEQKERKSYSHNSTKYKDVIP